MLNMTVRSKSKTRLLGSPKVVVNVCLEALDCICGGREWLMSFFIASKIGQKQRSISVRRTIDADRSCTEASAAFNAIGATKIEGRYEYAQEVGRTTAFPGPIEHKKAVIPTSMTFRTG